MMFFYRCRYIFSPASQLHSFCLVRRAAFKILFKKADLCQKLLVSLHIIKKSRYEISGRYTVIRVIAQRYYPQNEMSLTLKTDSLIKKTAAAGIIVPAAACGSYIIPFQPFFFLCHHFQVFVYCGDGAQSEVADKHLQHSFRYEGR